MYAVCVTFRLRPGARKAFIPLVSDQAANSLARERGCLRFDVWTDPAREDEVFLYEIYDDRAAFDLHLDSDHFSAFEAQAAPMIADKTVTAWSEARR